MSNRGGIPREYTAAELAACMEHANALLERPELLPAELHIKLDTWRADMLAEQEDRSRLNLDARRRTRRP